MTNLLQHTDLKHGMNTDELCEVYFSFLVDVGAEHLDDVCATKMFELCKYGPNEDDYDSVLHDWLNEFMRCWSYACDAEHSLGHAIKPYHGWSPKNLGNK